MLSSVLIAFAVAAMTATGLLFVVHIVEDFRRV